ncbi:MAG: hypothetical protein ACYSOL_03210 [Planctomycetota bacterium]|jgi:hypothetical protein
MKKAFLLLTVICLFRPASIAENAVGYSAEWLSSQSSLIATARPISVEKTDGDISLLRVRFKIQEIYKGPLSDGDSVTIYDDAYPVSKKELIFKQAIRSKASMLIYCNVAENIEEEINGKYVFTMSISFMSAYYTDKPVQKLYTPECQILSMFSELLERTKKQIEEQDKFFKLHRDAEVLPALIVPEVDSPAYQELYDGGYCFIFVPGYKKVDEKPKYPVLDKNG